MIIAARPPSLASSTPRWAIVAALALAVAGLLAAAVGPLVPTTQAADPSTPTFLGENEPAHSRSVHAAAVPNVPNGFADIVAIQGRTNPMSFRFAPDGHVFVGEKSGRIWVYDTIADTSPTLVADLSTRVYNYWDRGLMSIALDPQFPADPYLYVLYAFDARIGGTAPVWSDVCPANPGSTTDGCVSSSRLSRLTLNGSYQMTGAEDVFMNDWCAQFPSHSVGDLRFGADGALYASGGDGASFTNPDFGQFGGTVLNTPTEANPCGDPPAPAGTALTQPDAEGGALRSQSLQRAAGPAVLGGTIIRVSASSGAGLASNPLGGSSDLNARRIVGQGLRNPFRFTFRPGTNDLWVGDVGWDNWEEINNLPDPTGATVANFGWPCYEGDAKQLKYDGLNLTICEDLYAENPAVTLSPFYTYNHNAKVVAGESCAIGSSSITGVAFYDGGPYPSSFDGALFFADYSRDCIWAMPASGGQPDPSQVLTLVAGNISPVDLEIGPNGDLFYADMDGGSIHRIVYTVGNQAPVASFTASSTAGPVPLTVQFDGSASADPDGDPIMYAWDLDGDGQFDDSTAVAPTWTYTNVGTYPVALRVTDPATVTGTMTMTIAASTAPVPVIDLPTTALHWKVGQDIPFSGHATDLQDGTLPASSLSWKITLEHCPTTCHAHPLQTLDGVAAGSFAAPDHDYPSYLEITLTATDSDGLHASTTVRLDPQTVDLTFTSSPVALQLSVGSYAQAATPFTRRVIVGSTNVITAIEPQTLGEMTYVFDYWADGGAQTRTIVAPATARSYVATFAEGIGPGDASNTCTSSLKAQPLGPWLTGTVGAAGDVDWYRFTVTSARTAQVNLGDMPANLRLDLYSSCGTLLATSDRSGTISEEIFRRLSAGTYRVRISGTAGAWSPNPYVLRFRLLGSTLSILSSSAWVGNDGVLRVAGEILNTTTTSRRTPRITVTLYNSSNHVLARKTVSGLLDNLRSLYRSPFLATFTPPAGFHHYTISATATIGTSRGVGGLTVTSAIATPAIPGRIVRTGSMGNLNGYTVRAARIVGVIYDARGGVLNVGYSYLSSITARHSRPFVMSLDDRAGTFSHWMIRYQAFR